MSDKAAKTGNAYKNQKQVLFGDSSSARRAACWAIGTEAFVRKQDPRAIPGADRAAGPNYAQDAAPE